MLWKEKLLRSSNVYLILDREVADYDRLLTVTRESLRAGVDLIQLRDKKGLARDILPFVSRILKFLKKRIPLIINDRIDLVLASGADGVHLGQKDIPLTLARKMLPPEAIIGISCQNLKDAQKAQRQGADYIGFGSVFRTLTKPDRRPMDLKLLAKVIKEIKIPVFAIGGIGFKNISEVRHLGVQRVAVCREICWAQDVRQTTHALKEALRHQATGKG